MTYNEFLDAIIYEELHDVVGGRYEITYNIGEKRIVPADTLKDAVRKMEQLQVLHQVGIVDVIPLQP